MGTLESVTDSDARHVAQGSRWTEVRRKKLTKRERDQRRVDLTKTRVDPAIEWFKERIAAPQTAIIVEVPRDAMTLEEELAA